MDPLTYREAGVDIDGGDEAVRRIAPLARATSRPEVLGGVGAFAAFVRVSAGLVEPVLVSSTDGVGSKLKVAFMADCHDTVGIDLVASGLHSNGYSLARRIIFDVMGLGVTSTFPGTARSVADELLEPTRIYATAVKAALEAGPVSAMAHVTGGGLTGNVPRVLPEGCRAVIRRGSWKVPPVFEALRDAGGVDEAEMFRTFNMGIGYVVVVDREAADQATGVLTLAGETVYALGEVVAGARGVELAS